MTIQETLSNGFSDLLGKAGKVVTFRYFSETIGSVWDDDVTFTQSGTDLLLSGIVLPLDNTQGSQDSVLLEQGKLIDNDLRLFINGSIITTGSDLNFKVIMGSGTGDSYTSVPTGTFAPEINGTKIYKKAYIRKLTNGSLFGE